MTEFVRTLETLELVGGALCLDYVNTVNSRVNMEHDYLTQYSDLVGWTNKVGLFSPALAGRIQKQAKQSQQNANEALDRAREIRELLYRLFSRAASGSEPDKKDMEILVGLYGEAIAHGQFLKQENHYITTWKLDETFDALLRPIVHSAGELLLSEELVHVKECPGCGWLFMDTSKNQSRRWCNMNTCGARDKMRRYHKRKQAR